MRKARDGLGDGKPERETPRRSTGNVAERERERETESERERKYVTEDHGLRRKTVYPWPSSQSALLQNLESEYSAKKP